LIVKYRLDLLCAHVQGRLRNCCKRNI